jgi:hypothetical protein
LKLVRRAHLFAGLFLTPWVFLYGISAFLFNHPEAFPDREACDFGPSEVAGTALEGFPTARTLAHRVVAALNAPAGPGQSTSPAFRLLAPDTAVYSRDLFATATGKGREHSVRFDPDGGAGTVRSTSLPPMQAAWPGPATVPLDDAPRDRIAVGVPALLTRLGLEADVVAVRNPPDCLFRAEAGGRPWRIAYNIQTGTITARPIDPADSPLSTRRFLTGLHLARGYPTPVDCRWAWAVVVDVMAVALVFWGISGLLMWWQMKGLRRIGMFVLLASLVAAAATAAGMHDVLAR